MPYINPYIEKIENHPHIWTEERKIFACKGHWRELLQEHKAQSIKQKIENIKHKTRRNVIDGDSTSRPSTSSGLGWNDGLRLMVEIGTGMGNFFSTYTSEHPDTACVGIEIKYKRLHRTYEKCEQKGRGDVVLLKVRGEEIGNIFGPEEIDELYILFSDPWPKKAHYKHRLITKEFLHNVATVLKKGGLLLIKTDHAGYAEWIEERLAQSPDFIFEKTSDEDPEKRPSPENSTEFETMGRSEGSAIVSFLCKRC